MELDLTEAVEAAADAVDDRMRDLGQEVTDEDGGWGLQFEGPTEGDAADMAKCAIEAAAPILERQVREKIAQEIEGAKSHPEHQPTCQSCITESVYRDRHAAIARGSSPSSSTEEKGQR